MIINTVRNNARDINIQIKNDMVFRLINLVENSGICPVVFEIFERLKRYYRIEFEEHKRL